MPFLATFAGGAVRPYRAFRIGSGNLTVNYSVVAGGGAASLGNAAGGVSGFGPGGAGGLLQATSVTLSKMAYVVVGAGGAGVQVPNFPFRGAGANGSKSALYNGFGLNVSPLGGGGGYGQAGGSGGGNYDPTGGLGTAGQGNNGGGAPQNDGVGGGGGAGGAGVSATTTGGGTGGAGLACSATDGVVRAGGGGGHWVSTTGVVTAAAGGTGGGGAGRFAANGTANTGGGAGSDFTTGINGNGGSGIVIIQYASAGSVVLARGGTITVPVAGTVRHTFTSSGIFTIIA